jgi:hypothetical protein
VHVLLRSLPGRLALGALLWSLAAAAPVVGRAGGAPLVIPVAPLAVAAFGTLAVWGATRSGRPAPAVAALLLAAIGLLVAATSFVTLLLAAMVPTSGFLIAAGVLLLLPSEYARGLSSDTVEP